MTWTRIKQNYGMGMVEQWILRECDAPICSLKQDDQPGAPICSLKQDDQPGAWSASLLNTTGISTVHLAVYGLTLEQAQKDCERELRRMGWKWRKPH